MNSENRLRTARVKMRLWLDRWTNDREYGAVSVGRGNGRYVYWTDAHHTQPLERVCNKCRDRHGSVMTIREARAVLSTTFCASPRNVTDQAKVCRCTINLVRKPDSPCELTLREMEEVVRWDSDNIPGGRLRTELNMGVDEWSTWRRERGASAPEPPPPTRTEIENAEIGPRPEHAAIETLVATTLLERLKNFKSASWEFPYMPARGWYRNAVSDAPVIGWTIFVLVSAKADDGRLGDSTPWYFFFRNGKALAYITPECQGNSYETFNGVLGVRAIEFGVPPIAKPPPDLTLYNSTIKETFQRAPE